MAGCGAGEVTIESVKDRYPIQDYKTGDWGYIDEKGEVVIEPSFKSATQFREGLAKVEVYNQEKGVHYLGFINGEGKFAIKPQYSNATDFFDGLAKVRTYESNLEGISFFINTRGEKVFEVKEIAFEKQYFSEGLTDYAQNGKLGFINKKGEVAIEAKYDGVGPFKDGLARVEIGSNYYNSKVGFINKEGEFVIEPTYRHGYDFSDGLALVNDRTSFPVEIINTENQIIREIPYDGCNLKYGYSEGLLSITLRPIPGSLFSPRLCAFIDREGKVAIKPQFNRVLPFKEGLAAVRVNSKWGFIDKTGEFVIQPQYDRVSSFQNGLAKVSKNPLLPSAYIDKENNIVWKKIDY